MSQLEKLSGNEVYTGWIYVIKNTINNKIYIGQTSKNLYIRFKQHKRDCEKNFHNMLIHKAMNKYGTENFLIRPVDIIKCVTLTDFKKELNKLEMYYINIFKTTNKDIGYNCSTKQRNQKWISLKPRPDELAIGLNPNNTLGYRKQQYPTK